MFYSPLAVVFNKVPFEKEETQVSLGGGTFLKSRVRFQYRPNTKPWWLDSHVWRRVPGRRPPRRGVEASYCTLVFQPFESKMWSLFYTSVSPPVAQMEV